MTIDSLFDDLWGSGENTCDFLLRSRVNKQLLGTKNQIAILIPLRKALPNRTWEDGTLKRELHSI
jgi:hypothetical protein